MLTILFYYTARELDKKQIKKQNSDEKCNKKGDKKQQGNTGMKGKEVWGEASVHIVLPECPTQ
jgi:hypothetical protein